jgi:hypothetical protein
MADEPMPLLTAKTISETDEVKHVHQFNKYAIRYTRSIAGLYVLHSELIASLYV